MDGKNPTGGRDAREDNFASFGAKKPEAPTAWTCPDCGQTDITSKFCPNCGRKKDE